MLSFSGEKTATINPMSSSTPSLTNGSVHLFRHLFAFDLQLPDDPLTKLSIAPGPGVQRSKNSAIGCNKYARVKTNNSTYTIKLHGVILQKKFIRAFSRYLRSV